MQQKKLYYCHRLSVCNFIFRVSQTSVYSSFVPSYAVHGKVSSLVKVFVSTFLITINVIMIDTYRVVLQIKYDYEKLIVQ